MSKEAGKQALIVGASGIVGRALAQRLLSGGWRVHGLSRGRNAGVEGCTPVVADLTDAASVASATAGLAATHVFFTAWSRQATEQDNIRVNGAMVRNVLDALGRTKTLQHAALVTGLKHYLGPFEAYACGAVRCRTRRFARRKGASRSITSTTSRKIACSRRRPATASRGACIVRIRSSASRPATP